MNIYPRQLGNKLLSIERYKAEAIRYLKTDVDIGISSSLKEIRSAEIHQLLIWLDQAGLSLYLLERWRQLGVLPEIPAALTNPLQSRLENNHKAVDALLMECSRLNAALTAAGVPFIFVKGLTLTPDFCPDPYLRHYADIDMLISPEAIPAATEAVASYGYRVKCAAESGEVKLSTPETRLPSRFDGVFDLRTSYMLEFHQSLWEPVEHVNLTLPPLTHLQPAERTVRGISFPSLPLSLTFFYQLLHSFRHFLGSWVRLAWLYEIALFLRKPRSAEFWVEVSRFAGDDPVVRNACGLIVSLTSELFAVRVPEPLECFCLATLPPHLTAWVKAVGPRWARSGKETQKATLIVHRTFLPQETPWLSYLFSRLLPVHKIPRELPSVGTQVRDGQKSYWLHRARSYFRSVRSLPLDYVQWSLALRNHR